MNGRARPAIEHRRVRERLYELLPAFLRYRDQSEPLDSPLRALMAVLERQYDALDRDIGGLYDDWFIETCQDWIAPYLGDLLGMRGLDTPEAWVPGQRTRIANALAYRRLKGTRGVLERVARDVTGWSCVATPFFDRLAANQSLEHPRLERGRTVDLRDRLALARFGGPFDSLARRPQISGIDGLEPVTDPRQGYNLPNLGLYFWRLQSYPARRRSARKISAGCYTFHPLGIDQPLFNRRRAGGELTEATTERQVPGPLVREILAAEIDALRAGAAAASDYLGRDPVLEILEPHSGEPIPWQAIEIADLSDWRRPAPTDREPSAAAADGGGGDRPVVVALDPELGRLAFATDHPVGGEVEVSYNYAGQGDLGGGPYYRPDTVSPDPATPGDEPGAEAAAVGAADGHHRFRSLQEAIESRPADADSAVIQLVDSATYGGWSGLDLEIGLRAGAALEIGAAPGETPTFIGDLRVVLGPGAKRSRLTLEGLHIGGKVIIATAGEADDERHLSCELEVRHCTLVAPDLAAGGRDAGGGGIEVEPAAGGRLDLRVRVRSSILGPVAIPAGCGELAIFDSIVDGGSGAAIAAAPGSTAPACPTELRRCTLFGRIAVAQLLGEDTIFLDPVAVAARHLSRLGHCYLPPGSAAGSLERCQPGEDDGLAPAFTSRAYGQPSYGQLAARCPREIRSGASNGSEMGAYSALGHAFREANLAGILEEHVPWGLQPRVFHVT